MADRREIILDLLARDKTGPATKSSAGNLKGVGEAAEGAAKSTEKLGKESDKAEDQVQRFGRSAKTAAGHVDDLDDEIENVERELVRLAVAWKEAESAADKADLSKAIRRTQKDLRELNKSKGILGALIPEPAKVTAAVSDVGMSAGQSFSKSFSEAVASASGPASIGVAIAAAIMAGAALPIVGATVAAGILGAAGIGGVIGGLTLAAKDSRVKAAAKGLGTDVSKTLNESAGAFVPVALQGIEKIRGSFKRISGDLKGIFDASSRYVGPLVDGVTGLVENAIGGVREAVEAAGPVIDVIGRNLPVIGKTIGDVFEKVARHAPEAATALDQVFKVLEGGVVAVGAVVDKLSIAYGALAAGGALGNEARENWIKYSVEAGIAKKRTEEFGDEQVILAEKTRTAAEAAEQQITAIEALNTLERARVDPLFAFVTAQEKVTTAQEANTEAIKKYGPKSKEAAAASRDLTDAALGLQDAAGKVGTEADGTLTPAMRRALEQAHLTKAEIKGVEDNLRNAKKAVDAYDGLSATAKISANTATAATNLADILAKLRAVRSKRITVSVGVSGAGAVAAISAGRILSGRAGGGDVERGTPYIVGEKRPEVFVPETNGTIVPSVGGFMGGASRSGGTRMGGGGGTTVMQLPRGAILSADRLVEEISKVVRRRGGSVQLVLGGTNA